MEEKQGPLAVGEVVVTTMPGTTYSMISRVLEVPNSEALVLVEMLEDDQASVPLATVRRLAGLERDIATAAMEQDIGRVLFLGGGDDAAAADPVVQSTMCLGLRNLARENESTAAIAAAGGIAAVIGAMGRCEGHAGVQQYGCRALVNLAFNGKEGR